MVSTRAVSTLPVDRSAGAFVPRVARTSTGRGRGEAKVGINVEESTDLDDLVIGRVGVSGMCRR
jgi:hypothetical protein